jgi:Uma2 family endonuclease
MASGGAVMTQALTRLEVRPIALRLNPVINLTDDQFFEICRLNRELRIERTAEGELLIMPPTGGDTGRRNLRISFQLELWAERETTGVTFDSSSGFRLPNGAARSPDASWVRRSRLAELTREQRQRFIPLCPDFVIELRSHTDNLGALQAKMNEYMDNGALLGWLIDPEERHVYVYRAGKQVERLDNPSSISGESELPGFALDLEEVWEPKF